MTQPVIQRPVVPEPAAGERRQVLVFGYDKNSEKQFNATKFMIHQVVQIIKQDGKHDGRQAWVQPRREVCDACCGQCMLSWFTATSVYPVPAACLSHSHDTSFLTVDRRDLLYGAIGCYGLPLVALLTVSGVAHGAGLTDLYCALLGLGAMFLVQKHCLRSRALMY